MLWRDTQTQKLPGVCQAVGDLAYTSESTLTQRPHTAKHSSRGTQSCDARK
jgi:hypothetical protein